MRLIFILAGVAVLAALAILALRLAAPRALDPATLAARLAEPLAPPAGPLAVYHLGHSLVGRDMPAMLAQMAGEGHRFHSQLGWGASLRNHWTGEVPGMAEENRPPAFRPAREALESGDYDAVILTEMVELKDAIRYHDSPAMLANWARLAAAARPDVRLYLYETWHRTDDPAGWAARIAADGPALWEGTLLARAMAEEGVPSIRVIPGGRVLAAVAAEIEAGRIPGLATRDDLFARAPDGSVDTIHLGDIGAWVIAATHHAVLTHRPPDTAPGALLRADGSPATPLAPETAAALARVVWQVVTGYPATGVRAE
jgi:hypothetical protein